MNLCWAQSKPVPDNGSFDIIVWYCALADGLDRGSLAVGLCHFGIIARTETLRAPFIITAEVSWFYFLISVMEEFGCWNDVVR